MNLLRFIRSSIDASTAMVIYNAMIMPLFTYCGSVGLGWPDSKFGQLRCIENEALKSRCHMKKSVCKFVLNCLERNVSKPFKNYFERSKHENCTRNTNYTVELPLVKTCKTGQKCAAFVCGRIFYELPPDARKIESRIVFKSFLNKHFS